VGRIELGDGGLQPQAPLGDLEARCGADSRRVEPLEPELVAETLQQGRSVREVGEDLVRALAWDVDRSRGRNRSHEGAESSCGELETRGARNLAISAKSRKSGLRPGSPVLCSSRGRLQQPALGREVTSVLMERTPEAHDSGEQIIGPASVGSLSCVNCGYAISLEAMDDLPNCPACGGTRFERAPLFDQQATIDVETIQGPLETPAWVTELRASRDRGAPALALDRGNGPETIELEEGWTRIGRSGSADVRLDDATVSRRHALVVRTPEDELRALDDRSLNGLFVNGEKVEWAPLGVGDELEIGRYRLYVLSS
jgi:hypothetical protein